MKILQLGCIIVAIAIPFPFSRQEPAVLRQDDAAIRSPEKQTVAAPQAEPVKPNEEHAALEGRSPDATPPKQDLTYLAYYAYSEVPPDRIRRILFSSRWKILQSERPLRRSSSRPMPSVWMSAL